MLTILAAAAIATAAQSAAVAEPAVAEQAVDIRGASATSDPGLLINRGIVLARAGEIDRARAMFEAARDSDQWIDLQVPSGAWVDSRTLARRAIEMLKRGEFSKPSTIAAR